MWAVKIHRPQSLPLTEIGVVAAQHDINFSSVISRVRKNGKLLEIVQIRAVVSRSAGISGGLCQPRVSGNSQFLLDHLADGSRSVDADFDKISHKIC